MNNQSIVYSLRKSRGRWLVEAKSEDCDDVFPTTNYETSELAVARLAQLLGVKNSITPQTHPESISIGSIN
jgi:hypothetical protein